MNYVIDGRSELAKVAGRRASNDEFRRSLSGGDVFFSAGILALGGAAQAVIIDAVCAYDHSDSDGEWDDHAVGNFEVSVEAPGDEPESILVFFRVIIWPDGKASLTLLLADEWWGCGREIQDCVGSESHG